MSGSHGWVRGLNSDRIERPFLFECATFSSKEPSCAKAGHKSAEDKGPLDLSGKSNWKPWLSLPEARLFVSVLLGLRSKMLDGLMSLSWSNHDLLVSMSRFLEIALPDSAPNPVKIA